MNVTLREAEATLQRHSPAAFGTSLDAGPECIEFVRAVEDEEAWKAGYESLEAFYAAHEERHPDIRLYGGVRREILTEDLLTSAGGTIAERIERSRPPDPS